MFVMVTAQEPSFIVKDNINALNFQKNCPFWFVKNCLFGCSKLPIVQYDIQSDDEYLWWVWRDMIERASPQPSELTKTNNIRSKK